MTDQVKTRGRKCSLTADQIVTIKEIMSNDGTIKDAADKAQCSYAAARYYLLKTEKMTFKRGRRANVAAQEVVTADA